MHRAAAHIAVWVLTVAALLAASCQRAGAHALDPPLLDLEEAADGTVQVTWKVPVMRVLGSRAEPILPSTCRAISPAEAVDDGLRITTRWSVRCPEGLVGQQVGVDGLGVAKTDALVRVALANRGLFRAVVSARQPSVSVPPQPSRLDVLGDYVRLGIEHILSGPDHLLFVFGLILLVNTTRLLVETITAFTIGHSITLTCAVLGAARFSQPPIEVLIALSIFVLAAELSRELRTPSLMRRFPWAMALTFGLLHGFGFASALRDAGLPADDIGLALFSFNVGVEIGQLAFVLAVLATRLLLRQLPARYPRWVGRAPVYAMGSLAAFWCFERAAALFR